MKLLLLLALLPLLVIPAYAEQQAVISLPFDRPYIDHNCQTFFATIATSTTGKARVVMNCYYVWEFDGTIKPEIDEIIPDGPGIIPNDEIPPGLIDLINDNPPPPINDKDGNGIADELEVEVSTTPEIPPDVVVKLAECLRGYDRSHEWGAFVDTEVIPYWMDRTREQFTERDNLNRQFEGTNIHISAILKGIEECRAIQRYVDMGMIGPEEALKAVHDRLDIGKGGVPERTIRGDEGPPKHESDSTRNIDALKIAEERAIEFACLPQNEARKLCQPYHTFTGVNRGISQPIVSRDTIVNSPNSPMVGKTAIDVMSEYKRAKDASILTPESVSKYVAEINQITCDNYFKDYKHQIGTDSFPSWL
ncbi:MAG TPA: hypothetical protein VJ044_17550, partial [Candidatus Hodarchaeales archaeon]|nr:hypothetical protein [Candidatus Hodarchaeales archaeon]